MKDISFSVAAYAQNGNLLYFSAQDNIGIYILNMDTLKISYKNHFPFYNFNARFLWGKALKVEGGIWLSPFQYTLPSLYYDIDKNRFFPVEYSTAEERQIGHPYCYLTSYKDKIYIFPIKKKQILIYNMNRKFVKKIEIDINEDIFTMYAALNNNKVYLPIDNSNRIIEFDMETFSYSSIVIGTEDIKILDIIFVEGCLYFSSRQCPDLYCYNLENKDLKKTCIGNEGNQIDSLGYDGEYIWGTILYGNKIFKTDIQFRQIELWDIPTEGSPLPDNCLWREKAPLNYRYMIDYGNSWYITSDYENAIYVFDRIKEKFTNRINICVSHEIVEAVQFKLHMKSLGMIKENESKNLGYYLRVIK